MNIEEAEAYLREACDKAIAVGISLVTDNWGIEIDRGECHVPEVKGRRECCAIGAALHFSGETFTKEYSSHRGQPVLHAAADLLGITVGQVEALYCAFDGMRFDAAMTRYPEWAELGDRLRADYILPHIHEVATLSEMPVAEALCVL